MTAPSVEEVMRSCRAARPRCAGRRERRDDPAVDDRADGRADHAADGGGGDAEDRAADAAANGGAGGAENEGGHGQGLSVAGNRKAKAMRRRQDGVSGSSITPSRS
jgi:hypothetical protein